MSDQQKHAYPPPEKGQPPHPSQSAYPPAMGYPPVGQPGYGAPLPGYVPPAGYGMPPSGQPGYGMPPPGQPGYGMPPPGQPGYGMPPPGQPGYGMPPPGQPGYGMHPPGQPGYGMPPPGQPGYGMPPPSYGYPQPGGFKQSSGNESDDSQPGDPGLRSSNKGNSIKCTFENNAGTKVMLCKIDEHGKPHQVMKIKKGRKEELHVKEGDVFFASGKKKRKRRVVINNNTVYTVMAEGDGENKVRAEILNGPDEVNDLASEKNNDVEVKVKFVNRSKRKVQIVWIDHKRKWEKKKVLKPGKCYTTKSYEGNCWVAHDEQDEDEGLFLNYGYFYSPWKTRKAIERVIITEDRPWSDSSGSSSDSD